MDQLEAYRVFNLGIGMVAVVPASAGDAVASAVPEAILIGCLAARTDDEAQVRLLL